MDEYKFYSYVDDKSILVITPKNQLVRIRCPFLVKDNSSKVFQVDSVLNFKSNTYYLINGKALIFSYFKINLIEKLNS